ncbi:hypothetical protein CS022_00710 [Veronia nyctiphanis]|uniref:Blue (type 1) copper domain-containing protein n=1 Tax=Veronia nyctiphanis TaxID=1278244 RepID=A0A4Q0YU54_9GAMM|nr:plastocyanin/azurin family copper-binding protein [Veronia nyctiphanis]RXJ74780.1 hypothetical protein CS022_00710 [Veronia nyctiphanis]
MKQLILALCLFIPSVLSAAEHEVKMLNGGAEGAMVFSPAYLKISAGDTVNFVPTDIGHNAESTFTPTGSVTWKGELNKPVSVTFDKEGVYAYQCMRSWRWWVSFKSGKRVTKTSLCLT